MLSTYGAIEVYVYGFVWILYSVCIIHLCPICACTIGIIITVLFFFDHNVSSLISQTNDMRLKKGAAFHWDFFVLGLGKDCLLVIFNNVMCARLYE
ncbi:hypothetical protein EON65_17610 [archaeon]|nr:MAG: hypothetical protein EON65_17610 [archaeon]